MFEIIKSDDKSTGTNGDCVIHLNDDISGEYRLHSFTFCNNLYTVNDNNNKLILANTSDVIISNTTLTNGDYDGESLALLITNEITDLTASYNDATGQFTFTYTSDFKLLFENYSNTCHKLLGFDKSDYTSDSNTLTSVNVAQLLPFKHLYLDISENDNKQIKSQSHYFYSFLLYDTNSTFGSMFRYICDDVQRQQKINIKSTKKLKIKILDSNNKVYNVSDWIMILEK